MYKDSDLAKLVGRKGFFFKNDFPLNEVCDLEIVDIPHLRFYCPQTNTCYGSLASIQRNFKIPGRFRGDTVFMDGFGEDAVTLDAAVKEVSSKKDFSKSSTDDDGTKKEPMTVFLHSCHHLPDGVKQVVRYMLKFMKLCGRCSFDTFYTVMKDRYDIPYEKRKEIVYRMLQDKVITSVECNGQNYYDYTPERVGK